MPTMATSISFSILFGCIQNYTWQQSSFRSDSTVYLSGLLGFCLFTLIIVRGGKRNKFMTTLTRILEDSNVFFKLITR